MKLVTFTSFKGGAGKSTALMAAVPGLLAAGKRLALLEADENDTLALWRSNARESGTWDEAVTILEATDLGSSRQALQPLRRLARTSRSSTPRAGRSSTRRYSSPRI